MRRARVCGGTRRHSEKPLQRTRALSRSRRRIYRRERRWTGRSPPEGARQQTLVTRRIPPRDRPATPLLVFSSVDAHCDPMICSLYVPHVGFVWGMNEKWPKPIPSSSAMLRGAPLLIAESKPEFDRIRDALDEEIKPRGILEQMYVEDVAYLSWEVLRLRRSKTAAVNLAFRAALKKLTGAAFAGARTVRISTRGSARRIGT